MTLYDAVIKRRQGWRQEGLEEGRAQFRNSKIAAVLAHPELTAEQKVLVVEILNAGNDDAPGTSDAG